MDLLPLAVQKACERGDLVRLSRLLASGSWLSLRDALYGATALHWACLRGHREAASMLLNAGLPLESRTTTDGTPLTWACMGGDVNVIRFLLESNADISAVTQGHGTPLHHACSYGHLGAVDVLLEWGADATAPDIQGQMPGDAFDDDVPRNTQREILRALSRYEAQRNLTSLHGPRSGLGNSQSKKGVSPQPRQCASHESLRSIATETVTMALGAAGVGSRMEGLAADGGCSPLSVRSASTSFDAKTTEDELGRSVSPSVQRTGWGPAVAEYTGLCEQALHDLVADKDREIRDLVARMQQHDHQVSRELRKRAQEMSLLVQTVEEREAGLLQLIKVLDGRTKEDRQSAAQHTRERDEEVAELKRRLEERNEQLRQREAEVSDLRTRVEDMDDALRALRQQCAAQKQADSSSAPFFTVHGPAPTVPEEVGATLELSRVTSPQAAPAEEDTQPACPLHADGGPLTEDAVVAPALPMQCTWHTGRRHSSYDAWPTAALPSRHVGAIEASYKPAPGGGADSRPTQPVGADSIPYWYHLLAKK